MQTWQVVAATLVAFAGVGGLVVTATKAVLDELRARKHDVSVIYERAVAAQRAHLDCEERWVRHLTKAGGDDDRG